LQKCKGFFLYLQKTKMEWITEVYKYHNLWLKIMHDFGAKEFSEDYVQDMYIRLIERSSKEKIYQNGVLNKSYMYFTLRNTYIINMRKQRNNSEGSYKKLSYDFKDLGAEISSMEVLNKHIINQKNSYDLQNVFDEQLQKEIKYEIILQKIINEILTWRWYDQLLFTIYFNTGKSIRTLEKEIGISYFCIFHTLKNCKERIKIAIGEDYEDFINKDYEHIKL